MIESPVAAQEMDRAEDEIEPLPILLHPGAAGRRMDRVVIELDAGADFQIGIGRAQSFDFVEIDALVITIVIRQGDVAQTDLARVIRPRLEQRLV